MTKTMTFRLAPDKVEKVQSLLKCKTKTDAVDMALDLVVGNSLIAKGHDSVFGKFKEWPSE
jgi:hypothetical protein